MVDERRTAQRANPSGKYTPTANTRNLTQEYDAAMKRQQLLNQLLTAGKNIFGGIASRVATGLPKVANASARFLGALGQRLAENYDEAVGHPMFGASIRDILYGPQQPIPQASPYPGNAYFGYGPQNFYLGPNGEIIGPNGEILQTAPYPSANSSVVGLVPNSGVTGNAIAESGKQVVFIFDADNDTITGVLSEFNTVQEAQAEVEKLRKQGIPAFYGAKGVYENKVRLKA
jgi:hypothetical protein